MPKLNQIPIDVSEWASLRQAVEWVAFNWLPLPEYLEIINPKRNPTHDSNLFSWEESLAVDRAKRSLFHAFVAADLVVMGKEGYGTFVEEEDGEIEHRSYASNYCRIDSHIWKLSPNIIWHQSRCSCRISRSATMECKSWSEIRIKTSRLIEIFPPDDLSIYNDHTVAILKRMTSDGPTDSICEDNSSETYVGAENRASDAKRVAEESVATLMLGGATTNPPSSQTNNIDPNNLSVSAAVTDGKSVAEDYPPYIRFLIRIYRELGAEVVNGSKKEELGDMVRARWPAELGEPSTNKISAMATFLRMPEAQRGGARRQRTD